MIEQLTWTQEGQELIPTQEGDLNQVKVQESKQVQKLGPSQEVETLVHMYFLTMECDLMWVIPVQK